MEMVRGDTFHFKFKRKTKSGETIIDLPQKMYITFKYGDEKEPLFQKTLDNGITFDNEYYHVVINPEDTNDLPFSKLVYDIEVINEDKVKTIYVGELELTKEVDKHKQLEQLINLESIIRSQYFTSSDPTEDQSIVGSFYIEVVDFQVYF